MIINVNLSPNDGYHFKDADGVTHRAEGWKALIKKVERYRVLAGKPVGNPREEIFAQACRDNPQMCSEGTADPYPQQTRDPKSGVKVRVLQFLAAWKKQRESQEGIVYVSGSDAKARADVCATCPRNTALPGGCGACKKTLSALRSAVLGPSRAIDGRLGGCDATGADLPTQVHLDEVRVNAPELPARCWRKAQV